jgi:hypothetical protein
MYSEDARRANYRAIVAVSLFVGADGRPEDVKALKAAGLGLDERTVRLWITDSKVTHFHDSVVDGNGAIEWMKFSVEITLPDANSRRSVPFVKP